MSTVEKLLGEKPSQIWTVSPDDTVFDAIKMMNEKSVGALPVIFNEKLVGIISERDYARKVILEDKKSKETLVKEIMLQNHAFITVSQWIKKTLS